MNTKEQFKIPLSLYDSPKWKHKKQSNIYVFMHSPFFPDGKLKIYTDSNNVNASNQRKPQEESKSKNHYLQLEKYRSFILTFSNQNIHSKKYEELAMNISINYEDDLPFKIMYWRVPKFFCKTTSNFFLSTDYQIKSSGKLMENSCFFFDPKGVSNLLKMTIFSSEQITIEFYINSSLYTNPDYECSSSQPNETLSCIVPYSQPFLARVRFNKKKFIQNLNCDDNNCDQVNDKIDYEDKKIDFRHKADFTLDYSSLYKTQEVHDCFIDAIPFIQYPSNSESSSFLSEGSKSASKSKEGQYFIIDSKVCIKFSGYKTALISRIAIFFLFIFVVTFILQLIGYIDFCGWTRKPGEVAFTGLKEKVAIGEPISKKSKTRKIASSMDELYNQDNTVVTSPLVFSNGFDTRSQLKSNLVHKKTFSCANFKAYSQQGHSREFSKLSGSGSRNNNKSGSGCKRTGKQREVVFQLPNFISNSASSSSSSLQEYRFENLDGA